MQFVTNLLSESNQKFSPSRVAQVHTTLIIAQLYRFRRHAWLYRTIFSRSVMVKEGGERGDNGSWRTRVSEHLRDPDFSGSVGETTALSRYSAFRKRREVIRSRGSNKSLRPATAIDVAASVLSSPVILLSDALLSRQEQFPRESVVAPLCLRAISLERCLYPSQMKYRSPMV